MFCKLEWDIERGLNLQEFKGGDIGFFNMNIDINMLLLITDYDGDCFNINPTQVENYDLTDYLLNYKGD